MHRRAEYRKSKGDAELALNALECAGLGRWEQITPGRKGGRASKVFVLGNASNSNKTPVAVLEKPVLKKKGVRKAKKVRVCTKKK